MMNKQLKADLAIFSITIIWGSSFIVMKNISEDIPAYAYLAMRFLVASIILTVIFNKNLKGINLSSIMRGSLIGLMLYAGMMLQVLGLKTTTASNSATSNSAAEPIWPIWLSAYAAISNAAAEAGIPSAC
jgi:drug/metabolite transporter (DMT)-like permease